MALAQGQAQPHTPIAIPRHEVTLLVDIDPLSSDPDKPKIEAVAADANGKLYAIDSAAYADESSKGRLFRIDPNNPVLEVAGNIPACARVLPEPFGRCFAVHFNHAGDLFIVASRLPTGARVLRIPAADLATGFGTITDLDGITYVSGVTGVNGLIFDENGFLFAGGSDSGGVYLIPPGGGSFTTFNAGNLIPQACRCTDNAALTCPITGPSPAGCNPQRTVSNGVTLDRKGDLFVADTARGAIWKIDVLRDENGTPGFGGMSLLVQDPLLQGADGLIADAGNNLWVFANERNAVVRVTPSGQVHEMAQNDSHGPLEFPAGGAIVDGTLYISNFDNNRRDNRPNTNGIGASIAQMFIGVPASE